VAVEPYLAGLAAQNRTEQDLAEMRDIHQRFEQSQGDVGAYKRLNLDWHLAVARASRNEVLVALMEAIAQPIFDAADYQEVTTAEIRRDAIRAHAAILHSIEAQDFKQAYSRMEKHLSAYATVARRLLVDRQAQSGAAAK
jgi:DNA-binding FadR family transcriptional regulator